VQRSPAKQIDHSVLRFPLPHAKSEWGSPIAHAGIAADSEMEGLRAN
jgi:hypothetical protein